MSISRNTIADILGIAEDEVKCENCTYKKRWINDAYMCSLWAMFRGFVPDDFCAFFRRKEDR